MIQKKLKKILLILITASINISAQIGINNSNPQATLDVIGSPLDPLVMDGIIAPRLTGNELNTKNYKLSQTGALVYVTSMPTAPSGQTVDVTSSGYYYFDGTKWIKSSYSATTTTETDGTTVFIPVRKCAKGIVGGVGVPGPTSTMTFSKSGYIFRWRDTGAGKFTLFVTRTSEFASQSNQAKSTWFFSGGVLEGGIRGDFTIDSSEQRVLDASFQTSTTGKASLIINPTAQTFNIDFSTLNISGNKIMSLCIEQTVL